MPDVSLETRLKVGDDVVVRELDGEAVLLNLASGLYFGLNPVGTRMWQLIGERRDLADVVAVLCDEFDAPAATIEADLVRLVGELLDRGLMVRT